MGDHDAELDELIDEHRQLMSIMAAVRRAAGGPGSELDNLLDQLETALAHHTAGEERGLFHVLRRVEVPAHYVGLFEHDHSHLVDLIQSARTDRSSIDALLDGLEAHMAREEDDMFPAAEQLLSAADWDAVEGAVADLR